MPVPGLTVINGMLVNTTYGYRAYVPVVSAGDSYQPPTVSNGMLVSTTYGYPAYVPVVGAGEAYQPPRHLGGAHRHSIPSASTTASGAASEASSFGSDAPRDATVNEDHRCGLASLVRDEKACRIFRSFIIFFSGHSSGNELIESIINRGDVGRLAVDEHGVYVVEAILQHGSCDQKGRTTDALLEYAPTALESHDADVQRRASFVLEKVKDHVPEKADELYEAVLKLPPVALASLASDHKKFIVLKKMLEWELNNDLVHRTDLVKLLKSHLSNNQEAMVKLRQSGRRGRKVLNDISGGGHCNGDGKGNEGSSLPTASEEQLRKEQLRKDRRCMQMIPILKHELALQRCSFKVGSDSEPGSRDVPGFLEVVSKIGTAEQVSLPCANCIDLLAEGPYFCGKCYVRQLDGIKVEALALQLKGSIARAAIDPCANFVVRKLIEVLDADAAAFIAEELTQA